MKVQNNLFIGIILLAATSCGVVTKQYKRPEGLQSESLFREMNSSDTVTIADIPWKQLFKDPVLQGLIKQGLENNYDLKIAVARMQSAAANLKQSKLAFLPSVSVSTNVSRVKSSSAATQNNSVNTLYELSGAASWELDIWGKLSSNKKAYVAAYMQSEAYRRAVQTQLIATISGDYYQLLAYDEQIRIVEATVKNREKDVEIVKTLKEGAVVTGADLMNSRVGLRTAALQIPDLKQSRRKLENALSIILALPPDSIARTTFEQQNIDSGLNVGISSQLLANRPDVQQAEYAFRNAFELTNVARTYFYPSLTISGSGGWATANTLRDFFTNTFYGSLIGGLTQPIFNQGLNKQRLNNAEATQLEAYYDFQKTLLSAGQEVSDALYAYDMAIERDSIRQLQIIDLEKATEYTKELLRYSSSTNYTDVLTAEQNLLSARLNSVTDRLQQLQAVIELYRALGGGWK